LLCQNPDQSTLAESMIRQILGGRYEIIIKLGQGNFSTTFKLWIGVAMCVVKHFLPQTTDPLILRWRDFYSKMKKVLSRLGTHDPTIWLTEEDQQFYLVLEFEGHDLSREITPGNSSLRIPYCRIS